MQLKKSQNDSNCRNPKYINSCCSNSTRDKGSNKNCPKNKTLAKFKIKDEMVEEIPLKQLAAIASIVRVVL